MFGSMPNGANAYAKVGVETGVTAASPHKLIVMLFDGAMIAISTALQHMRAGNIPEKGQYISKAIMIIDHGLRASLNKNAGGDIATNLDSLYEYMSTRLLQANLKSQPEILEEVYALLKDLKSAWEAIGDKPLPEAAIPVPTPENVEASQYNALDPHTSRLVKA